MIPSEALLKFKKKDLVENKNHMNANAYLIVTSSGATVAHGDVPALASAPQGTGPL